MLTEQEIFDKVSTHLLRQGGRSSFGGACKYRGEHGLKCAAGCLIPDDKYVPEMEGMRWAIMIQQNCGKFLNELTSFAGHRLISTLQKVHDKRAPVDWRGQLKELAVAKGLVFAHCED